MSNKVVGDPSSTQEKHRYGGGEEEYSIPSHLPLREIPGSHGVPFLSPIMDRLDFFYRQGHDEFFAARIKKYGSTVFRCNAPPGPFVAGDPRVIAVLDAKSFPVLFDASKVEKKNIFTGTFMPSTAFTGGYRVCSYLDPSEPNHTRLKQLLFNIFAGRKAHFVPEFRAVYARLFDDLESQVVAAGRSDFNALNDHAAFEYICRAYFGASTAGTQLGSTGPDRATKWVLFQLAPILSLGKPWFVEELLLHTFPLPPCLVKKDYRALLDFVGSIAGDAIEEAAKLGISRDEAVHNLTFAVCFNTYVGFKSGIPGILKYLAKAEPSLHARLAEEIRGAVGEEGGKVTLAAVEKMELTASVVLETFRLDPPVRYQYGKAKRDLVIESHDAAFKVKKGEVIFGYQTFATRDERVFEGAGRFVAERFVGEKGRALMKYVLWANGPHTDHPTVDNKMCAGKNVAFLFARLLLVELFLRYDTFQADVAVEPIGSRIIVKSLTKATTTP